MMVKDNVPPTAVAHDFLFQWKRRPFSFSGAKGAKLRQTSRMMIAITVIAAASKAIGPTSKSVIEPLGLVPYDAGGEDGQRSSG